jgi:putative acetyltransferase
MQSTTLFYTPVPEDYPAMADVWEASVRATHHFLGEDDIQFFKPLILNEYFKQVTLLCTRDERSFINGFIGIADGKIEMLFLHPDSRGKGLGKKLLQHVVAHHNVRLVDVNEQNEDATAFYKHMGFGVISRSETDAMGKPFPLLMMELKP